MFDRRCDPCKTTPYTEPQAIKVTKSGKVHVRHQNAYIVFFMLIELDGQHEFIT